MKKEKKHIIQQELSDMESSALNRHNLQEQDGFRVPGDYFEQLPSMVQEKLLQQRGSRNPSFVNIVYRRVVPVMSAVILLAAVAYGLFFYEHSDSDPFMALEDYPELQYLAEQPGFDDTFMMNAILESDLTADEILFMFDHGAADVELFGDEFDEYDELMEDIFEQSQYYGMESRYMLSYLD